MTADGLPLQLRILEAARRHAVVAPVHYEECYSRDAFGGNDVYRFTCAVFAGRGPGRRIVAFDEWLPVETVDAMPPSARESILERRWQNGRERFLAALNDPASDTVHELARAVDTSPRTPPTATDSSEVL